MRNDLNARAINIEEKRTTLNLEPEVWNAIDMVAARNDLTWSGWVFYALDHKPAHMSRSAWIRIAVINELTVKLVAAEERFTDDMV